MFQKKLPKEIQNLIHAEIAAKVNEFALQLNVKCEMAIEKKLNSDVGAIEKRVDDWMAAASVTSDQNNAVTERMRADNRNHTKVVEEYILLQKDILAEIRDLLKARAYVGPQ